MFGLFKKRKPDADPIGLEVAKPEPEAAPKDDQVEGEDEIQHAARLINFEDLPDELRDNDAWAVEPIAGNLWAMYGEETDEGFAVMEWDALITTDRRDLVRWLCGVRTLNRAAGGDFTRDHISAEMMPGVPMFTNGDFHPQIGAALLMPPAFWQGVMKDHSADAILVAVPAPSRIFWTARADLLEPMRGLVANAFEIEEDTLSPEIYRFDGTAWTVVGNARAQA